MTRFRSTTAPTTEQHGAAAAGLGLTTGGRAGGGFRGVAGSTLPGGRRRRVPHLVLGALLVVVCAVSFAVIAGRVDHRTEVLALARSVTVGQRLSAADMRPVRASVETGVTTIPATDLDQAVGRTMAVSLPAGALLAPAELGPAQLPAGQAITALAVRAGQMPPDLAASEHIVLVPVPSNGAGGSASTTASGAMWSGVVVAVQPPSGGQEATVVSVQLAAADARTVAALPTGQINIVLVPGP